MNVCGKNMVLGLRGRSGNDASDEEQMRRLELRADSSNLPKILQDRLEEDTLRRSDFLKERKMLRDKRL